MILQTGGLVFGEISTRSMPASSAILTAAKEAEIPARWLLALTTGLRQAEVLGLSWPAIDWDTHRINIEAQLHYDPAEHGCSAKERCSWWSRGSSSVTASFCRDLGG